MTIIYKAKAEFIPNVINNTIIRECIEINKEGRSTDPYLYLIEEKKKQMKFDEIECLNVSFKNLHLIQNLEGLINLTKLKLDNNSIKKIENINHLINLEWLDLSFNEIEKIENLETLTKLKDLSLFNNKIKTIENLDNLKSLEILSIGNNKIDNLRNLVYLRKCDQLKVIKLIGNPVCKNSEYKNYLLSHVNQLKYLDYYQIKNKERNIAQEQYQDEIMEIKEREIREEIERKENEKEIEKEIELKNNNIYGIYEILREFEKGEDDWYIMSKIPGYLDHWNDIKEKYNSIYDAFKINVMEYVENRNKEKEEYNICIREYLDEKDKYCQGKIIEFNGHKKKIIKEISNGNMDEGIVLRGRAKLMGLKKSLIETENIKCESILEINEEFEIKITEITQKIIEQFMNLFIQLRDLLNIFVNEMITVINQVQMTEGYMVKHDEKYTEEIRMVLSDKETMMNMIQNGHDMRISKIDILEEEYLKKEKLIKEKIIEEINEKKRNKERLNEIVNYIEMNQNEINNLL